MSIKYYQLAKDEEPPDEFCAVRDIGGEPSEYMFYVPEAENAKLREEFDKMDVWHSKELTAAMAENAKLRELAKGYENLTSALCNERECDGCPFDDTEQIVCKHMRLQTCLSELGVEAD